MEEAHEKALKTQRKEMVDLSDELAIYKRRLSELHLKFSQASQKQAETNKAVQSDMRRRENEWNEAIVGFNRQVKTAQLHRQQCLDFIDLIRKEEKNVVPQIDTKIKHYFNAAF